MKNPSIVVTIQYSPSVKDPKGNPVEPVVSTSSLWVSLDWVRNKEPEELTILSINGRDIFESESRELLTGSIFEVAAKIEAAATPLPEGIRRVYRYEVGEETFDTLEAAREHLRTKKLADWLGSLSVGWGRELDSDEAASIAVALLNGFNLEPKNKNTKS